MSIPPPPGSPDDPTRPMGAPVPPAAPVPPPAPAPGYERERVVEQVVEPEFDPRFALASIEDSLRSLRTAVVLLGIVSVAALALSGYALIRAIEADRDDRVVRSGSGQSDSREVAALEERLDELEESIERDSGDAADESDVSGLSDAIEKKADASEVAELKETVARLSEQAGDGEGDETAQVIADLTQRLDDVDQRLQQVEQAQEQGP